MNPPNDAALATQADIESAGAGAARGERVVRAADYLDRSEIDALRTRSTFKTLWLIGSCWGSIFGLWALCVVFPHPLLWLVAIPLIGCRQLGLQIINHDAAHCLLASDRAWNDWLAEWFANRPLLGASVVPYRKYHLEHHRFTQQPKDPDLVLSAPFPITRRSYLRKFWRDVSGQTGWSQHVSAIRRAFGPADAAWSERAARGLRRLGPNLAINAVFLTGFALAGAWYLYFLLWVVPFFTWFMVITRVRNIGEHACVPDNDDRLRNTRTTHANWLERLFIAPYWVNYHLEHHLLVSVPCYNLPRMHALLRSKGLEDRMEIQPGYLSVLRLATSAG